MASILRIRKTACRTRSRLIHGSARWLAALLLCLQAVVSARAGGPIAVTPEQTYQLALEARTERDYPAMLSLLRQAARADDLPALELLGSVLLTGSALYGDAVRADPCEAAYWIRRALLQGSFVARHQSIVLNALRDLPEERRDCSAGTN
ncbi:MAG: sel1 repeat family protein [Lautropia sp.]